MRAFLFLALLLVLFISAGDKQLKLFDEVWKLIHDEYYDQKFNGVNWERTRTRYRPDAERASNDREIYQILEKMTAGLKDAHTRVVPPQ